MHDVFKMMARDEWGRVDPVRYEQLRQRPLLEVLEAADEWVKILEERK